MGLSNKPGVQRAIRTIRRSRENRLEGFRLGGGRRTRRDPWGFEANQGSVSEETWQWKVQIEAVVKTFANGVVNLMSALQFLCFGV